MASKAAALEIMCLRIMGWWRWLYQASTISAYSPIILVSGGIHLESYHLHDSQMHIFQRNCFCGHKEHTYCHVLKSNINWEPWYFFKISNIRDYHEVLSQIQQWWGYLDVLPISMKIWSLRCPLKCIRNWWFLWCPKSNTNGGPWDVTLNPAKGMALKWC